MYVPDCNEAHFKEETGKKIDMRLDFLKFFSTEMSNLNVLPLLIYKLICCAVAFPECLFTV